MMNREVLALKLFECLFIPPDMVKQAVVIRNKYLVAFPLHVDIDSKQKAAGS